MFKKIAAIDGADWLILFFACMFYFYFFSVIIFNIIYVDMPHEELITLGPSFITSWLIVGGAGLFCFLYIKEIDYHNLKKVIWALFFGFNTFGCGFWVFIIYRFDLNQDRVSLLLLTFISIVLTIQTIIKKPSSAKAINTKSINAN